ncbi:RNA 2',3'-cyclic phosphodiesterase [Shewanella acanthi]|uniref:RNA 2',3'-cyclic phosphodiesterase n=1 Tax=Shewanella acanthi TaxID=2864212 RepID=UPI001C65AF74|nr:RNA 2',3'-cyclic phosphodiesterase [Shewanella acanthi]QYJ79323.1 RNA 2',3'-cyclic phosphodiesterase [Shewanella acanthi]
MERLFLGFAPSPSQLETLTHLQRELVSSLNSAAKAVHQDNFHLTLAFLGMVSQEQKESLIKSIDEIAKPRFSVQLDSIAEWPRAQVCCLKGENVCANLAQLAKDTKQLAQQLTLHISEHGFRPHISLFRKAKSFTVNEPSDELLELPLSRFNGAPFKELVIAPTALHLYLSSSTDKGVEYKVLHSWDLS